MDKLIMIQQLSKELGITGRTLRYWEEKGLYESIRNPDSHWRYYDQETITRIKFIVKLRELDIAIKDIKLILSSYSKGLLVEVFNKKIELLNNEDLAIKELKHKLMQGIDLLENSQTSSDLDGIRNSLINIKPSTNLKWEELIMNNQNILSGALRVIKLPQLRMAVCNIISPSPENEAISTVVSWAKEERLLSTARIFGYNTTEYKKEVTEYGWAAGVTIPEFIDIPKELDEKRQDEGIYVSLQSTNEIYDSWQLLMKLLGDNKDYIYDETRLCLEEHIATDIEGEYHLNLLAPVKKVK